MFSGDIAKYRPILIQIIENKLLGFGGASHRAGAATTVENVITGCKLTLCVFLFYNRSVKPTKAFNFTVTVCL